MTAKEINLSIESMKVNLTKWEKIKHWCNLFFISILLILFGIISIYEPISKGKFPTFGIIIIIAFYLLVRQKLNCTKLDLYRSELSDEQFKQANKAAAMLNNWVILSNRNDYFSAVKITGWQWEGIKITAILKDGKIYLNSVANPSVRSNPFTFGLKKYKLALIRQYQLILLDENVVEIAANELEKRGKESEWNFKNILKRAIGYGLSTLLITVGIWMISLGEINGIIAGVIVLAVCSRYILYDVKVIRQKSKEK